VACYYPIDNSMYICDRTVERDCIHYKEGNSPWMSIRSR